MNKEWINIRLNNIFAKLSTLQSSLFTVEQGISEFLEEQNKEELDAIFYGKEVVEGTIGLIEDVKTDINLLNEQIEEQNEEQGDDFKLGDNLT